MENMAKQGKKGVKNVLIALDLTPCSAKRTTATGVLRDRQSQKPFKTINDTTDRRWQVTVYLVRGNQ